MTSFPNISSASLATNASVISSYISVKNNSDGGGDLRFASDEDVWKIVVEASLAFVGVIGNALVITIIKRIGKKVGPFGVYIVNLAIADVGTLVVTFPLAVVKLRLPMNWPFGEFVCRYVSPVAEIFYGASVWCIAVIAMERYQKMTKLKQLTKQHTKDPLLTRARVLSSLVWFGSFLVFSVPLYFVIQYRELKGGTWCGPLWSAWGPQSLLLPRLYICLLTAFSFIIPLSVIAWTYIAIAQRLSRSNAFIRDMQSQTGLTTVHPKHGPRQMRYKSKAERFRLNQNRRAMKLLTPITITFAISMLPLNVFRLAVVFWPDIAAKEYYRDLFFVISIFVILNSSVNPIIYSMFRLDFRQALRQLCTGRR